MNFFKSLFNFKSIAFALAFIVIGFIFSQQAYADSYIDFCNDGGLIKSTVYIGPPTSFNEKDSKVFKVAGFVESQCNTRPVILTAQHFNKATNTSIGNIIDIIPLQTLPQGSILGPLDNTKDFISPSTPGLYSVRFNTKIILEKVFVKLREEDVYNTQTITCQNGSPITDGSITTYVYLDFFKDAAGTQPIDVTGTNLAVDITRNGVLQTVTPNSGTSYELFNYYSTIYSPDTGSCQANNSGQYYAFTIIDGSSKPVPYEGI